MCSIKLRKHVFSTINSPPLTGGDCGEGVEILHPHPYLPPSRGRVLILRWFIISMNLS